jgi:hypothetical protein
VQKGSADLAFLYSGVWVRPALGSVESSGKSLPIPVSAILLEAVIIGEFAYGTTVASDSSVSGIIRTRFADKGACQGTTTQGTGDGRADQEA